MPEFKDNELLVKLVAASACASDLVPWHEYLGPKTEGLVAGHEGVGIMAAGKAIVKLEHLFIHSIANDADYTRGKVCFWFRGRTEDWFYEYHSDLSVLCSMYRYAMGFEHA